MDLEVSSSILVNILIEISSSQGVTYRTVKGSRYFVDPQSVDGVLFKVYSNNHVC